jgi:hypothetical protein
MENEKQTNRNLKNGYDKRYRKALPPSKKEE